MNRSELWVKPDEVISYSSIDCVKKRMQTKLKFDIKRAQEYVVSFTHNQFPDEKYPTLPENVKMAIILLTELYAKQSEEKGKEKIASETWQDDYSYTLADTSDADDFAALNLSSLLSEYVIPVSSGKINMEMFKL